MIKPYFETENGILYQGNALDILKDIESESIDCVMTSPPYWALRDYGTAPLIWDGNKDCEHEWGPDLKEKLRTSVGPAATVGNNVNERQPRELYKGNYCFKCGAWKGSLGLEPTFHLYIQHLIQIFDEIKRVLKKTGTCWINIGDSFSGSGKGGGDTGFSKERYRKELLNYKTSDVIKPSTKTDLPSKSLCQIPERFSIAMTDKGWIKRNTIIWYKPNCMPSSANDRFTVDYEYLYFFVKNQKYWFEQQFDNFQGKDERQWAATYAECGSIIQGASNAGIKRTKRYPNTEGRNKRCVWKITTQSSNYEYCLNCKTFYWESARKHIENIIVDGEIKRQCPICKSVDDWTSHFAQYPEQLCYTPIEAGCPEYICKKCGKARKKIYEKQIDIGREQSNTKYDVEKDTAGRLAQKRQAYRKLGFENPPNPKFLGYSDCECGEGFEPGIVLDPFMGAGTTLLVAEKLKRKNIGIEISKEYCDIAINGISRETAQYKMDLTYPDEGKQ